MDAATRGALAEVLAAAPPSYLAKALLDIHWGRMLGVALGDTDGDGEATVVTAAECEAVFRAEMDRRLQRSAHGKGKGT
jgi:hypothetical protein